MDRRDALKTLTLGALAPAPLLNARLTSQEEAPVFESRWDEWPDVRWVGPEYWGNRLQDWVLRDGRAECTATAADRTLHCLTHRLAGRAEAFDAAVTVELRNRAVPASAQNTVGFRFGIKGRFDDYRSAAVQGTGVDAGLTTEGRLLLGAESSTTRVPTDEPVQLRLSGRPQGRGYSVALSALDAVTGEPLATVETSLPADALTGNVALLSHFAANDDEPDAASARFSRWALDGAKFVSAPDAVFGPICFAQYTLHRGVLKLTAQLAPIEAVRAAAVTLETRDADGRWRVAASSAIDPLARTARFRIEDWQHREHVPYRVRLTLPLRNRTAEFFYAGTIAAEPAESDRLKVAVFSCNADHGFPDADVVTHVAKHRADMAVFLGDQYYERSGGFSIQTEPLDQAVLDCLHKWYMFGWSYRDIFRHIPAAIIPDDHDVYHGNIWGAGGKRAPIEEGWGYPSQDDGGYKMPAEWVNMVHRMQTSHLPDAYNPTPVKQGIGVYYTRWDYAGVSFGILADRQFKSPPGRVLPREAGVANGFVTNPAHHHWLKSRDLPDAELLGSRQMDFLDAWGADWSGGIQMKVVLSQSPFCGVHTLPEGATDDQMVPELPIPEPGEYVRGDAPAGDMDTNGWPPDRRDEVLRTLRRCSAFHIAGDQHLATVVRYGVDEFDDAGFAFTGPALNSIWPRRWWPPVESKAFALPDKADYTGGFLDAFGNRLTIHAAANPRRTGRDPAIVHDRATGYGIVVFDKASRTIRIECWPRYVDPDQQPDAQYEGWPLTIAQSDNDGRQARAWLPEIRVEGFEHPVVEVIDARAGEMVYSLRVRGNHFKPRVFAEGTYTVRVSEPDLGLVDERTGLVATPENRDVLTFRLQDMARDAPSRLQSRQRPRT